MERLDNKPARFVPLILNRPVILFIRTLLFIPFFLFCVISGAQAGDNAWIIGKMNDFFSSSGKNLVPARDFEIITLPATTWKNSWDQARQLVRNGSFDEAVAAYEALIAQKKNIEEVQGEYAKLLCSIGQYDKAQPILERLLQTNQDRFDYVFALARVMLFKSHFERAIDLFGRIFEKQSDNPAALAGLIRAQLESGKKREALATLEILHQLRAEDLDIVKAVVFLAYEIGEYEKVRLYIGELANRKDAEFELLLMAARVHDSLGLENQARDYWLRIADAAPDNMEALGRLALINEKQGKKDKILPYLLMILHQKPGDPDLLLRIANLYIEFGQRINALPYLEKILEIRPDDRQVLRTLISFYATLGNKDKTLDILERYYAAGPLSEPVNLKEAARQYDATGRFREAFPLYRRLLALSPDDPEILTALANDLLAIGENEGPLVIWKHPTGLAAKGAEVLRPIAELLERLGREDDFLEVLELIHDQTPDDDQVSLKLAILTLARGDLNTSRTLFDHLSRRGYRSPEFFVNRGRLFEKLFLPAQALREYEELLNSTQEWDDQKLGISRQAVHLICLRISGFLGRYAAVRQHFSELSKQTKEVPPEVRLVYADALRESGIAQAALVEYQEIVDSLRQGPLVLQALNGMALVYQMVGLPYESEQILRIALAGEDESCQSLSMIFDLTNKAGSLGDNAWIWLVRIKDRADICGWDARLFEAWFLLRQGEVRDAGNVSQRVVETIAGHMKRGTADNASVGNSQIDIRMELGRVFFELHDYGRAITQFLAAIQDDKANEIEADVYLEASYEAQGLQESADEINERLHRLTEEPGTQLVLAGQFGKIKRFSRMHEMAEAVLDREPESLKAELLTVIALEELDDMAGALSGFEKIVRRYPENDVAQAHILRLLFRLGRFKEALERCDDLLGKWPERPDLLQLKARILWAQNNWTDSVRVYESYLEPAAEEIFLKNAGELKCTVEVQEPAKPWWDLLVLERGQKPGLLDRVMDTRQAVDNSTVERRCLNAAAAPCYARYRWQKQLGEELSARRSVQRREYFQAVKQYEQILHDQPVTESLLFDLAGIYSQLDRLGEEASIYEELLSRSRDYPGLLEAMQRNRFKRRPRITAGYGYSREEGWNDYVSMKKEWEQVSVWSSPFIRHELNLAVSNIDYASIKIDRNVKAKRAELSYKIGFFSGLAFEFGGGIENFEENDKSIGLANCALFGKIGDKFSGRLSYVRDVVDDTTASITRVLTKQDISAGISLDLLPDLRVGGDYGYVNYSDGEDTLQYTLWASSIIFPDPTFLRFGYAYEFKDSREGSQAGLPGIDGFAKKDHPYWAPKNYWVNELRLLFKHRLSNDPLARGVPRYYTVEYAIGYDSNGNGSQKFKGGFYFEMTDYFIMESSVRVVNSPSYRSRDLLITAAYRW